MMVRGGLGSEMNEEWEKVVLKDEEKMEAEEILEEQSVDSPRP